MFSKLRAGLAIAGIGAALIALPSTPAAAATGGWHNTVSVTVKFNVRDDDGIFGGYSYATSTATRTIGLTPWDQDSDDVKIKSACAGGEVYGVLNPVTKQSGSNGFVAFYTGMDIYEGTSCYNEDWDGYSYSSGYLLYPGQTWTYTFSVYDYMENSPGDKVTATVTVTNTGWKA